MEAARNRYDRLTGLIDKAYEDKLEGAIDEDFFQRQRDKWDTERQTLVQTMERLNRADRANMDLAIQVLELGNRAYDLFCEQSPADKRLMLDLLCSNCEMGGGQLRVALREPRCKQRSLVDAMRNGKAPSTEIEGARPEWWALLDEYRAWLAMHDMADGMSLSSGALSAKLFEGW